jgi:hydroxylamine reductase
MENFILDAMFATLTNVNFDASRFVEYLRECKKWEEKAKTMAPAGTEKHSSLNWQFSENADALEQEGRKVH